MSESEYTIYNIRFATTTGEQLGEQKYLKQQMKFLDMFVEFYYNIFLYKLKDSMLNIQIQPLSPHVIITEINKESIRMAIPKCA